MPRMNGSAARTDGYNTTVVDMEDLKQARDRRASSARFPSVSQESQPADDAKAPAFWEQEDPFNEGRRGPKREEPSVAVRQENRRRDRQYELQSDAQDDCQDERYDWRQSRRASAPQPGRAEPRRQSSSRGRERRGAEPRSRWEDSGRSRQDAWRDDARRPRREQENPARWEFEFNPRQAERRQPGQEYARRAGREEGFRRLPEEARQAGRQGREAEAPETGRRSHIGYYVLFLMLALMVLGVVIGLKVFNVKTINVKGNESVTAQSIVALSGIGTGQNIFMADLSLAKKNIESDPLLEVIGISRVLPDKIEIKVRQRKPHGAIQYLGSYVVIDENGTVLDVRSSLPVGQYPLLTGVEIQPSQKGKKVVGLEEGVLKAMDNLLAALYDGKAMQYVSTINMTNPQDIKMYTGEGIEIDVGGPTDLDKKAQWIACTVPELRSRGYTSGTLYVTGSNNPVFSAAGNGADGQGEKTGGEEGGQTANTGGGTQAEGDASAA